MCCWTICGASRQSPLFAPRVSQSAGISFVLQYLTFSQMSYSWSRSIISARSSRIACDFVT
jgi:hypothetical protein